MAKGHTRWRGTSVEVLVYRGKGKYVSRTVQWQGTRKKTQDAADRKLRELLGELDEGQHSGPDSSVSKLIARWRRQNEHEWSPATTAAYDSYLRNHIEPAFGAVKVRDVQADMIDDFYADLRDKGLSPASIGKVHVILRRAFGEAKRWKWIPANPVLAAKAPVVRREEIDPPSAQDIGRLLELAKRDEAFYTFLAVAADTGARRGEVCALKWSNVDLDAGELVINRAIGIAKGGVVEKDTKTHAARRVALGAPCVQALKEHRSRMLRRAMSVGARMGQDAYVFSADPAGARPWRPDGMTARFGRLRTRAGLPTVRLHDLRHALVSSWLAAGVDSRTVMGRVGHSSLQTLTRYAHFAPSVDKAAALRLGDRFTQGETATP